MKFLELLEQIGKKSRYKKGNFLFFEGEEARHFYLLLRGRVRVYKSAPAGKELVLHSFVPLSLIAEMPAFLQSAYPASAVCEEDSELVRLRFEDFKAMCQQRSEFALMMMSSLFEKIRILEKELSLKNLSLSSKLALFVLENKAHLAKLAQKDIASALHTSAPVFSRLIKELKQKKLIATQKGKLVLLDEAGLKEILA